MFASLAVHNGVGKVRREWRDGREFLVAPLTSIVPGVLNGSKGSLYYPPEEIGRNVSLWDGIPLTVNHPFDPFTGEHLSAKDRGVWERQGIGQVQASTFNGRLRHVGWFDVERTQRLAPQVHEDLINNRPSELSTGLFTDNEASPGVDPRTGRPYDFIARNYRPDHIAILPHDVGACSRRDGCGVLVNKQGSQDMTDAERRIAVLERLVALHQELTVLNAQGRKTITGQFANGTPKAEGVHENARRGWGPHERDDFESADEELHEDDAASQIVGKDDGTGRGDTVSVVGEKGTAGTAGEDDDDGLQSPPLKPSKVRSRESPSPQVVVTGNAEDGDSELPTLPAKPAKQLKEPKSAKPLKAAAAGSAQAGQAIDDYSRGTLQNFDSSYTQATGAPTMQPHVMTKQAAGASLDSEHPKALGSAVKAVKASKSGDSEAASGFHEEAADAHQDAATDARKRGDQEGAAQHDNAAAMHSKAASMHDAACTMNADLSSASDDERKAAFAAMAESGGAVSKEAHGASKTAEHTGKASDHKAAALAHREAAEHHRDEGNNDLAASHSTAAKYHARKGKTTSNQRTVTMTRNQAIRLLTANCSCQKDVAALNTLSNETLAVLLRNAKMDSSSADATGGGTEQSGGEEDDPDAAMPGQKSEKGKGLEGGPKVGSPGKKPTFGGEKGEQGTENIETWLQRQPTQVQNTFRHAMEIEQREKAAIVRSITSNAERQKRLMRLDLPQLREQQAIVQEAVANIAREQPFMPTYPLGGNPEPVDNVDIFSTQGGGYAGAGGFTNESVTGNVSYDNDVLELPTMNKVIEESASPALIKRLKQHAV